MGAVAKPEMCVARRGAARMPDAQDGEGRRLYRTAKGCYDEWKATADASRLRWAIHILRRAMGRADTRAFVSLARLHLDGHGVERSVPTASALLARAAQLGPARAASALGGVYWRLKNDLMGAYTWHTIADALETRESAGAAGATAGGGRARRARERGEAAAGADAPRGAASSPAAALAALGAVLDPLIAAHAERRAQRWLMAHINEPAMVEQARRAAEERAERLGAAPADAQADEYDTYLSAPFEAGGEGAQ